MVQYRRLSCFPTGLLREPSSLGASIEEAEEPSAVQERLNTEEEVCEAYGDALSGSDAVSDADRVVGEDKES